ncbi:MAG: hypothetical protein SGCHY_003460 [Lobulomycetales sp.]
MAGNKINVTELRSKPKSELLDTLSDLKRELLQLRVQNINSGSSAGKATKIVDARKNIARVATVISQTTRAELKKYYKGKKWAPIYCRQKATRAIRRKLTKFEAEKKTLKQQKKDMHFPMRKYAVMA